MADDSPHSKTKAESSNGRNEEDTGSQVNSLSTRTAAGTDAGKKAALDQEGSKKESVWQDYLSQKAIAVPPKAEALRKDHKQKRATTRVAIIRHSPSSTSASAQAGADSKTRKGLRRNLYLPAGASRESQTFPGASRESHKISILNRLSHDAPHKGLRRTIGELESKIHAATGRAPISPETPSRPALSHDAPHRGLQRTQDDLESKIQATTGRTRTTTTTVNPSSVDESHNTGRTTPDHRSEGVPTSHNSDRALLGSTLVDTQHPQASPHVESSDANLSNEIPISSRSLVEARLVMDDPELDMVQAEEVNLEAQQEKRQKQRRAMGISFLVAIVVTLVVVVLVVILVVQKEKRASFSTTASPSLTPSTSPTAGPSTAPTLQGVNFLPLETLIVIEEGNPLSPQHRAYQWLLKDPQFPEMQEWRKVQRYALATFYYAFEGPKWRKLVRERWLNYAQHECYWFSDEFVLEEGLGFNGNPVGAGNVSGVGICSEEGRYRVLSLNSLEIIDPFTGNNIGLVPTIPPEIALLSSLEEFLFENGVLFSSLADMLDPLFLAHLPNLTKISLFQNGLTGTIPTNIGLWNRLMHLDLSYNKLVGTIPSEVSLLTSLEELHLDFNTELSGSTNLFLPLTSLRVLRARAISISGSIATELGRLHSLQILSLSGNWITGELPLVYFSEMSNLTDMGITDNYITGTVHSCIGMLTSLEEMWIGGNSLSGPIPTELGFLTSLKSLGLNDEKDDKCADINNLSDNQVSLCSNKTGNNFSGALFTEVGLLKRLQYLFLQENRLSNTLPSEIGILTELAMLNLSYNEFVGNIPSELAAIPIPYKMVLLGNQLSGSLPFELCASLCKTDDESHSLFVNCSIVDCTVCNCAAK